MILNNVIAGIALVFLTSGCQDHEDVIRRYARNDHAVKARRTGVTDSEIYYVSIRKNQRALDDLLPHVAGLAKLKELRLTALSVNSNHLAQISVLPLTKLSFHDCELKNQDLHHLSKLSTLEELSILIDAGPSVDDTGLVHLKSLPALKNLDLRSSHVAGTCFANGFNQLEELNISGPALSNDSIKAIAMLSKLKRLRVGKSQVTANALTALTGLCHLTTLSLPDRPSDEQRLAFYRAHVLKKRKSRVAGKQVPPDSQSPFANLANEVQMRGIKERNRNRRMFGTESLPVLGIETKLVEDFGREIAFAVFRQVDKIIEDQDSSIDYVSSTQTTKRILATDFAVDFQEIAEEKRLAGEPDQWKPKPKFEKLLRRYLSGQCSKAAIGEQ
jgi:hypothetical protein